MNQHATDTSFIWQPADALANGVLSAAEQSWLCERGSLTQRLRKLTSNQFYLEVLSEGWGRASLEEAEYLGIDAEETVWTREVIERNQGQNLIYARVIFPKRALVVNNHALSNIDRPSLGDILFEDPTLRRENIKICQLTAPHPYLLGANKQSGETHDALWARRSTFYYHGQPLLVAETFFPPIFAFTADHVCTNTTT